MRVCNLKKERKQNQNHNDVLGKEYVLMKSNTELERLQIRIPIRKEKKPYHPATAIYLFSLSLWVEDSVPSPWTRVSYGPSFMRQVTSGPSLMRQVTTGHEWTILNETGHDRSRVDHLQ